MAQGTFDKIKGYAKEIAGRLFNDDTLKRSGRADYASGVIKERMAEAAGSDDSAAAAARAEVVDKTKEKVLAREQARAGDTKS